MVSSQVEIASSSPFGCVLKDHNRRSKDTNAKAQAAFQKNLKELVREHFHTCISVSPASAADENSENHHINNNGGNNNNHNVNNYNRQYLKCVTNNQDNSIEDSSIMSCRNAKILDRWAAKQAQQMVSTIERQSQEAEFFISAKENSSLTQNSAPQSENLCGCSNLGASSLVMMWEARLHRPDPKTTDQSNTIKNNQNLANITSKTSSTSSSYNEVIPSAVEEPPQAIDSGANEEIFAEWDSAGQSSRSSVHIRSSDVGENERVRIVDIIRRLTSDGSDYEQGNNSVVGDAPSRRHSCGSDQAEIKALAHVVSSPKIRGRQAFNDLLFHMEQERQRELDSLLERQSVSRFPQRGRIQSMLRLRCLQRCMSIQNQQRSQSSRSIISSEANKSQQGSTIMQLRERFNVGADQATSDTIFHRKSFEENENPSSSTSTNHMTRDDNQQSNSSIEQEEAVVSAPIMDNSLLQVNGVHEEDVHEEASASSDATWHGTSPGSDNFDAGEVIGPNNWNENVMEDDDEEDDTYQANYDWITDIARPRSYWEDKRQEWYQEMLASCPDNNEIKQLLERRTVSNCLSSAFRARMDRLMMSRVQRQVTIADEELDEESQERMGQLMLSYFRRHSHSAAAAEEAEEEEENQGVNEILREVEEEEEEEEEAEERDEEESLPSMASESPFRSWNYSVDHEVADNSEQVSIIPSEPAPQSQISNQDTQQLSSATHPSFEMDLIYNLRGHMEQLQQEMSELKKMMQTCMGMQATLMNSLKQEVHPVGEVTKNHSVDITTTKRRSCCICYERHVDSFLYRCGHMCTCLKCAHELQWSSGKCPICRAPILDVVRAYMDS